MTLPYVMTPLGFGFCSPSLLTGQVLLVVTQAEPIAEWVQNPVRLTSEPWVRTKLWSLHHSDQPPKPLKVRTSKAGAGAFDYQGSSAPSQVFSPPQELRTVFFHSKLWIPLRSLTHSQISSLFHISTWPTK